MGKEQNNSLMERSAGAVVFYAPPEQPDAEVKYLLLLSAYWGFPKGNIEPEEDDPTAARREITEETGLTVDLIEGFRQVDDYWYRRQGQRIHKQAVFFLAQASQEEVKISWEHEEWAWVTFEEAMRRLAFQGLRGILETAHDFILNRRLRS